MTRLYHFGMRHADGHVEKLDGTLVPTPTEEEFFQYMADAAPELKPPRAEADDED